MATEEEVARILLKIKAVTLNAEKPYKFVSGILSPIYCDNRLLMSYPSERKKIVEFFLQKIKENNLKFDVIAGVATSGIPHAAWIAEKLNKPMVYVRSSEKEHGKENLIEGKIVKGEKALVIEDLISTGGSSVAAVEALRQQGAIVEDCLAIFSYEMHKAKIRFDEAKCNVLALSNFSALINVAVKEKFLDKKMKEKVLEWNKAPAEWGKKMGFE